jgi:6-phosphogluconate dehydrogenase
MVHNGIEYGLMQLISECYHLMKHGFHLSNRAIGYSFSEWNNGKLQSFLIEITAEIFHHKDTESKLDLIDVILDKAKQKGTGKWTSQNAMDLGMPTPTIDAAVTMRGLSSFKKDREILNEKYPKEKPTSSDDISLEDLEKSLLFAFIITYAQGLSQLQSASKTYSYELNLVRICAIWRGGCIIRAGLLEDFRKVFDKDPELDTILKDDSIVKMLSDLIPSTRKVLKYGIGTGIPLLAYSACLGYFDSYTTARLPSNLIQAQRDHFGSHTYERTDREGVFHTEW